MRYSNQIDGCQIWRGHEGVGFWGQNGSEIGVEVSPRSGGKYTITQSARWMIEDRGLDDSHKARLTTMLIDQRERGDNWPEVTTALIEQAKNAIPLLVHERANRLLRYLSNLTSVVGEYVALGTPAVEPDSFGHRPLSEGPTSWGAMAWSESVQPSEVQFLIDYLLGKGWIAGQKEGHGMGHFTVTVDGYSHIAEQTINIDSSLAFIAMWFDNSLTEAYERGIKPAVVEVGYTPLRIDQKEHINKIDDEIIAEIRRSRFLVADFTHGSDGARGGVYYEAGFAHGLDMPVIFTCRVDALEMLHFDTSHYSHIVWTNPADLHEKLRNRILAVIGEGPGLNATQ